MYCIVEPRRSWVWVLCISLVERLIVLSSSQRYKCIVGKWELQLVLCSEVVLSLCVLHWSFNCTTF